MNPNYHMKETKKESTGMAIIGEYAGCKVVYDPGMKPNEIVYYRKREQSDLPLYFKVLLDKLCINDR